MPPPPQAFVVFVKKFVCIILLSGFGEETYFCGGKTHFCGFSGKLCFVILMENSLKIRFCGFSEKTCFDVKTHFLRFFCSTILVGKPDYAILVEKYFFFIAILIEKLSFAVLVEKLVLRGFCMNFCVALTEKA